ncbi:3'(2'),5'-bisphosphate nucleotidase CysQ [Aeromonas sp. R6-2]|uniref:3'(2'),5'-bisphosphate nucleotidase CysQ n=2 Tax=unclassified Aeromonas TaxID=257493 RepID=UPI0034A29AF7
MPITDTLRQQVTRLAREAGDAILDLYERPLDVDYKHDRSPLTDADRQAHAIICAGLHALTPDWPVLSEESTPEVMRQRLGWRRFWLVDPLDGTKEFISRNGEFTVNIALIEEGRPVWGVVYAPVLGVSWSGGPTLGAERAEAGETHPVKVQPHRDGEVWKVVGSRHHLSPETQAYLDKLTGPVELVSMGSSLKLCLVAEGKAHLYPRLAPTCEWDTAAAQAVVEGAGGRVTTLEGEPLHYGKAEILNPWFVVSAS